MQEAACAEAREGSWSWRRVLARSRLPAVRGRELVPFIALGVVSTVGTILAPLLRHHGLLLAMLSPRLVFLGLAAHQSPPVVFVVLATARMCLAHPWHYVLGRRHGPGVVGALGTFGRFVQRLGGRRWVVLALVAVRPVGRHLMWAGTQRTNPVAVAVLDIGSTVALCVLVKAGSRLVPW